MKLSQSHCTILNDGDILLVDLHGILIPKWWLADKELIYQDPKCPPVNGAAVAGVLDCFRRKIFLNSLAGIEDIVWLRHVPEFHKG